jgi:peptide-methionine (S)-S-oxide reductase
MARRFISGGAVLGVTAAATVLVGGALRTSGASAAVAVPTPAFHEGAPPAEAQTVIFSGGCFWGVQAVFEHVKGVLRATAGYAGGSAGTATYAQVSTGETGHAESVRVDYDPAQVTFGQLLQIFFSVVHDPTQRNRQGPDHGPQYRSAIWYTTPEQEHAALAYIDQLAAAKTFSRPIVTEVNAFRGFHPAETYHQDYYFTHPDQPYIVINDVPKVDALERSFPALWREQRAEWRPETASRTTR